MSNSTIYTRAYSATSDCQLTSRRGPRGLPLSEDEVLAEFWRHADLGNRTATALVSVSTRIVDTIQRAFQKYHGFDEDPADIWVAFIEVPADADQTCARIHSASDLAERCVQQGGYGFSKLDPPKFTYEVLFEWAIPEDYVLHRVSLQTLVDRGLPEWDLDSTEDLRNSIATDLRCASPFEMGLYLGLLARPFGARSPLEWIAREFYYDSVPRRFDWSSQMVDLYYGPEHIERVDLDFFCLLGQESFLYQLGQGVDTAVMDWWLADSEFAARYKEFQSWRVDLWKSLHAGKGVGFKSKLSAQLRQRCEEEIEAQAVELGL